MRIANERQVTQMVVGPSRRSRWQEFLGGGSTVRRLARLAGAAGIDLHIIAHPSDDGPWSDADHPDIDGPRLRA
jgi:K+-sensing histidine kinase KdpD